MGNCFVYEGRLPSLNQYIEQNRRHPQAGAKLKREAQEGISWAIMFAVSKGTLRAVKKPCIVRFHWFEKTAKRDLDNISSFGRKVILDSLVSMKILPNDTQKWIIGFSDTFYRDEKDYIKVEIEEVDEVWD